MRSARRRASVGRGAPHAPQWDHHLESRSVRPRGLVDDLSSVSSSVSWAIESPRPGAVASAARFTTAREPVEQARDEFRRHTVAAILDHEAEVPVSPDRADVTGGLPWRIDSRSGSRASDRALPDPPPPADPPEPRPSPHRGSSVSERTTSSIWVGGERARARSRSPPNRAGKGRAAVRPDPASAPPAPEARSGEPSRCGSASSSSRSFNVTAIP